MEYVVSACFVAEGRPCKQASVRIRRWQVNNGDLHAKVRGGISRPGIRSEIRVAKLHQRRQGFPVGRRNPAAVFSAQEAVVEIADDFFEGTECHWFEAVASLKERLGDIEHQPRGAVASRILNEDLVESILSDLG